ncbi:hypothetical protein XELAEV_18009007mg [Xenopus laevis]|uniref:Uncharacterized protein n=1 Tax=Xenopus laevis TaxID=8355 RepID=A0A974DTY7_XENLA|nr:hypothetical protein XELAEV_18009007mg [Xenopus laevis]
MDGDWPIVILVEKLVVLTPFSWWYGTVWFTVGGWIALGCSPSGLLMGPGLVLLPANWCYDAAYSVEINFWYFSTAAIVLWALHRYSSGDRA